MSASYSGTVAVTLGFIQLMLLISRMSEKRQKSERSGLGTLKNCFL